MKRAKAAVTTLMYGGLLMILLGILTGVWSSWAEVPIGAIRISVTGVVTWLVGLIAKVYMEESRLW